MSNGLMKMLDFDRLSVTLLAKKISSVRILYCLGIAKHSTERRTLISRPE